MITTELKNTIARILSAPSSGRSEPSWKSVGGGSINQCYRVSTNKESVFVKLNDKDDFPGMFEAEAKGLNLIRSNSGFQIPEVIEVGSDGNTAYLVMEWLENGTPSRDYWATFADHLAKMHQHTSDHFGLDHNNYIGSLPQQNDQLSSWAEFYIMMRLEPQLRMASDKGLAGITLCRSFDRLFTRLESLFPEEAPALLHGDLWSGNFMCANSGEATIFDPAVYYGHREMDLAMSKLFGGFDRDFYAHYHRSFPLENEWEQRIPLGQLYPLLVHVNLFGASYLAQLKSCLRPFV